jgi:hypothetical protein
MKDKICIVTTLRAPKQQILDFVNYHLNIGVDHIFLFFDDPLDSSVKEFEEYDDVTSISCTKKHYDSLNVKRSNPTVDRQRANANFIFKNATKKGFSWLCHIDIDELIYLKKHKNVKDLLKKINKNIDFIRIPALDAIPEKVKYKNFFKEVNLFMNNFGKPSKLYFRGHIAGKSIVHTSAKISDIDIHKPVTKKGKLKRKIIFLNARILHYNCCGFDDWKNKWIRRMNGVGKTRVKYYHRMLKDFEVAYKKRDRKSLEDLYKKQFFVPSWLKKIGLLTGFFLRIKLNKELFNRT